jgi:hypothetical protein
LAIDLCKCFDASINHPLFSNDYQSGSQNDSFNSSGSRRAADISGDVIELNDDEKHDEGEPDEADDEHAAIQRELNDALNLDRGEVPEYVLRMREKGPVGYPPALLDEHVRTRDSLPFFGGSIESILPKRKIDVSKLPAFRGFTHLTGSHASPEFAKLMERLAEVDYEHSRTSALERSGIEEFTEVTAESSNGTLTFSKSSGRLNVNETLINELLFRDHQIRDSKVRGR